MLMAMIAHMLKVFFSSGFVAAAALQAFVSSIHWLDVRGLSVAAPNAVTHAEPALMLCCVFAAAMTFIEARRTRRETQT